MITAKRAKHAKRTPFGADGFLSKPIRGQLFREMLRRLLPSGGDGEA